jgi:hypothetical protein
MIISSGIREREFSNVCFESISGRFESGGWERERERETRIHIYPHAIRLARDDDLRREAHGGKLHYAI